MKSDSKLISALIISSIFVLVPVTGRFAVGIVIAVECILLSFSYTLIDYLIDARSPKSAVAVFQFSFLVFFVTIYKYLVFLFSPVLVNYVGFSIYLVAFSSILINLSFLRDGISLSESLVENLLNVLLFSAIILVFFLVRDILGYGTITLPSTKGFFEIKVLQSEFIRNTFFFGSIPFAILLLGMCLAFFTWISKKINISRSKK